MEQKVRAIENMFKYQYDLMDYYTTKVRTKIPWEINIWISFCVNSTIQKKKNVTRHMIKTHSNFSKKS